MPTAPCVVRKKERLRHTSRTLPVYLAQSSAKLDCSSEEGGSAANWSFNTCMTGSTFGKLSRVEMVACQKSLQQMASQNSDSWDLFVGKPEGELSTTSFQRHRSRRQKRPDRGSSGLERTYCDGVSNSSENWIRAAISLSSVGVDEAGRVAQAFSN
jgi:hypothetical protein